MRTIVLGLITLVDFIQKASSTLLSPLQPSPLNGLWSLRSKRSTTIDTMFRSTALLSFCLLAQRVLGQQVGTLTAETHPTVSTCLMPATFDVVLSCLYILLASSLRVRCWWNLHELQLAHRLGRQLEVDSLHYWFHQRTATFVHRISFLLITTYPLVLHW